MKWKVEMLWARTLDGLERMWPGWEIVFVTLGTLLVLYVVIGTALTT